MPSISTLAHPCSRSAAELRSASTRDFFVLRTIEKVAKLYLAGVWGSNHHSRKFSPLSHQWTHEPVESFPSTMATKIMTFWSFLSFDSMNSWRFSRDHLPSFFRCGFWCKTNSFSSVQMTLCTKSSSWARSHSQKSRRLHSRSKT